MFHEHLNLSRINCDFIVLASKAHLDVVVSLIYCTIVLEVLK